MTLFIVVICLVIAAVSGSLVIDAYKAALRWGAKAIEGQSLMAYGYMTLSFCLVVLMVLMSSLAMEHALKLME